MGRLTIVLIAFSALLFRPQAYVNRNLILPGDDFSYLAHVTAIVYFEFPGYEKEYFELGGRMPNHSIGSSLLHLPFGFAGSVADRCAGNDIVLRRSEQTLYMSWTVYGCILSTIALFWGSCLLMYASARFLFDKTTAIWTVICLLLVQGAPIYVYQRPLMPHVAELFVLCVLVYVLFLFRYGRVRRPDSLPWAVLVGCLAGLVVLIRPNNAILAIAWPIVLYLRPRAGLVPRIRWKPVLIAGCALAGMILVFRFIPFFLNAEGPVGVRTYETTAIRSLTRVHTPLYFARRFLQLMAGTDWGLLYTAPFILIGCISAAFLRFPLKREFGLLLFTILANVFLAVQWPTHASFYGYRYLVFAVIPLLVVPLGCALTHLRQRMGWKAGVLLSVICLFPILSMMSFSLVHGLSLNHYINPAGWVNPDYQLKAWGYFLLSPIDYAYILLQKSLGYLIALLFETAGLSHLYPNPLIAPQWDIEINLPARCFFILILPAFLYAGAWKSRLIDAMTPACIRHPAGNRNDSPTQRIGNKVV
jgi:hypothetical protein